MKPDELAKKFVELMGEVNAPIESYVILSNLGTTPNFVVAKTSKEGLESLAEKHHKEIKPDPIGPVVLRNTLRNTLSNEERKNTKSYPTVGFEFEDYQVWVFYLNE